MKANYNFIKGDGGPPVSHLPDPEASRGVTAEPDRMHEITLKAWLEILQKEGTIPNEEEWMQHYGRHLT